MRLSERGLENAAVFYLRRFPSTRANLRRVLLRKVRRAEARGETTMADVEETIAVVVQRMVDAGLVDDDGFARGLAESLHRRGMPERAIRQRLREKGVPPESVDAAVTLLLRTHQNADESAAWTLARRKRLGPYRPTELRAEKRERDLGAMARAGYPFSLARQVIDAADPRE